MLEQQSLRNGLVEDKSGIEEAMWLLGQPSLQHYLRFVRDTAVDGARTKEAVLAEEWRIANDYYHELEQCESGIADKVEQRDLDPDLLAFTADITADPGYQRAFHVLPTSFAMVELDRLIVCQKHVSRTFIEHRAAQLGPNPDPVKLFRFCLPVERTDPPVQIRRAGSRHYIFRSDSTDFRFHEPVLLRPDQVCGHHAFGPVASVLGLIIGFGSNFLNAIRVGNRLLLHNGYHRACTLRRLGITHAPCIVQTATRLDELEMTAKRSVAENPDFYFNTARPPLLKDFFDPKICKVLQVYKQVRTIEVSFEVRDYIMQA